MRVRSISLFVLSLVASAPGCGLVLDLDPPDPDAGVQQGLDAAAPLDAAPFDAAPAFDVGPHDAGSRSDAGVLGEGGVVPMDGGVVPLDATLMRDAGHADGGPARACMSHDECAASELCRRAPGICFGRGECVARPPACPDVVAPVCGCDWYLYDNACEAEAAGASVMRAGSCPTPTADWCARTVAAAPGPGCTRCFDDRDCGMLPLAPYCVSSSCTEGGEGYCALGALARPECWDARQCRAGERCGGARYDTCEVPLRSGRCE